MELGEEDFPCEINGRNYDACVCSGIVNKVELFAISSRETVEEAYEGKFLTKCKTPLKAFKNFKEIRHSGTNTDLSQYGSMKHRQ